MKRSYANVNTQQIATYFYGVEVEHTPAKDMQTLFVVGIQPVDTILEMANANGMHVRHIYLGANQSFVSTRDKWNEWAEMAKSLLTHDLWVTLDIEPADLSLLHESGLCEFRRFIPMISVKLPYIDLLNYNATIKIDDIGFEATNPGVWCHSVHSLQSQEQFTIWDKYTEDKVIK